ncbi:MAG: hypothetical protein DHS20C20_09830 [Ardenticatenaceae bacterium]|nr:MAG: hypothetical protein DHS20C20_09830 [Ardenticatenaceae bacterium]
MQATAKDLRFNVKKLLETVSRGEEVIITYRGKPQAKLIPFKEDTAVENELFGIWADNSQTEDVATYVRQIRKGRLDAD